jgi:hypothetical protein
VVNVIRQQIAVHAAEPPVPEPTGSEFGMAFENRKKCLSPVTVTLAAELIQADGRRLYSEMHRPKWSVRKKGRTAWTVEGAGHCICLWEQ